MELAVNGITCLPESISAYLCVCVGAPGLKGSLGEHME